MALCLAKGDMDINSCHGVIGQQNYPKSVNSGLGLGRYYFLLYFYPVFKTCYYEKKRFHC